MIFKRKIFICPICHKPYIAWRKKKTCGNEKCEYIELVMRLLNKEGK